MSEKIVVENQIAIFNLLSALFREVTGKAPKVKVLGEDGIIILEAMENSVIFQDGVLSAPFVPLKGTDKDS
jgi:hypothetical protein